MNKGPNYSSVDRQLKKPTEGGVERSNEPLTVLGRTTVVEDNLTRQMPNQIDLFHISIWKTAQRKHLERGGAFKITRKATGQTICLSQSKRTNKILCCTLICAHWKQPVGAMGDAKHVSSPGGELLCF